MGRPLTSFYEPDIRLESSSEELLPSRAKILEHLKEKKIIDVLVIGSDASALAVAQMATIAGLRVVLIAPRDFGEDGLSTTYSTLDALTLCFDRYKTHARMFLAQLDHFTRRAGHLFKPYELESASFFESLKRSIWQLTAVKKITFPKNHVSIIGDPKLLYRDYLLGIRQEGVLALNYAWCPVIDEQVADGGYSVTIVDRTSHLSVKLTSGLIFVCADAQKLAAPVRTSLGKELIAREPLPLRTIEECECVSNENIKTVMSRQSAQSQWLLTPVSEQRVLISRRSKEAERKNFGLSLINAAADIFNITLSQPSSYRGDEVVLTPTINPWIARRGLFIRYAGSEGWVSAELAAVSVFQQLLSESAPNRYTAVFHRGVVFRSIAGLTQHPSILKDFVSKATGHGLTEKNIELTLKILGVRVRWFGDDEEDWREVGGDLLYGVLRILIDTDLPVTREDLIQRRILVSSDLKNAICATEVALLMEQAQASQIENLLPSFES